MNRKKTAREFGMYTSSLIGAGISIVLMLLLSLLCALFVHNERLNLSDMKWLSEVAHVFSAFLGTWIALCIGKQKLAIISAIICGVTAVMLIICSILFYGSAAGPILTGVLSIGAGGAAACLVKLRMTSKRKSKRKTAFR